MSVIDEGGGPHTFCQNDTVNAINQSLGRLSLVKMDQIVHQESLRPCTMLELQYTAKIRHLLYKCSYFLCAVYTLAYVWPTFNEEINM